MCSIILTGIVVKSWAAGNLGNEDEDDEEAGGILESHGTSRKTYLADLMEEADISKIEGSSKFQFLMDKIGHTNTKRILIFSSW
jgi:hypothetical protein